MRASVHIAVVGLSIAACANNPGFIILSDSGPDGNNGDSEPATDSMASSGDDTSAGEPACEPRVVDDVSDVCSDWRPSQIPTPNLADAPLLGDDPCAAPVEMLVIRKDDYLYETSACDAEYIEANFMSLAALKPFTDLRDLPPGDGGCALMRHVGKFDQDGVCVSAAYAFWDGTGDKALRFAYTSAPTPNPFGPDAGFTVDIADDDLCSAAGSEPECADTNVQWKSLHFEFGRCSFDALHGETWTDLTVGARTYELRLFRAYDCAVVGAPKDQYGWFLRPAP